MEMNKVDSSNIDAVGYKEGQMHVRFKNGITYCYSGVTEDVYQSILTAESVGRAFNTKVKSQPTLYPFKKV